MAGRPTLLTPEVQAAVVDALEKGNTLAAAARAGGISFEAVALWRRTGKTGKEPYLTFLQATNAAMSRVETAVINCFYAAALTDWRAALAYAERRYWREWWQSKPGKGAPAEPANMSPEQLKEELSKALLKLADRPFLEKLLERAKDGKPED